MTSAPILYSCCVAAVFLFTTLMFVLYHCLVERRNTVVMKTANDTNAIVMNIFPKGFRDRVLQQASSRALKGKGEEHWLNEMVTPRSSHDLADFLQGSDADQVGASRSRALAELYPEATILVSAKRQALRKGSAAHLFSLFRLSSSQTWSASQHGAPSVRPLRCLRYSKRFLELLTLSPNATEYTK